MANAHNLALAKASLAAGLMRPDPQPVSREELKLFHESLDTALEKCSANDIQRCKEWLLRNRITSTARVDLLGKYLVALSSNLKNQDTKRAGSVRRQHLAILYVLNDLLHHLKYHETDRSIYQGLVEGLSRHLPDCLSYAVAFDGKAFPHHKARIARLLTEWSKNHYLTPDLQQELEQMAENSDTRGVARGGVPTGTVKQEDPFIMPAVHGDPSAPYHELPAASLMPHIIPNTPVPINPHHVRALQFNQGPAEPALVEVLKTFLKDIDLLYGTATLEEESISIELDDLGQKIIRDKQSGIVLSTETYYGWSKEFCENMKRKQNGQQGLQSQESDDSRERSVSPRKRMRYGSRDASRGRQQSRRRSYSRSTATSRSRSRLRSRTRSPGRQADGLRRPRSHLRSRSRSRSHSRSHSRSRPGQQPQRRSFQSQSYPEPMARHTSTSTTAVPYQQTFRPQQPLPPHNQAPSFNQQVYLPPQPPPPLPPPPQQRMMSSDNHYSPGMVPPRPVNWQGPWPPPPPIPGPAPRPGPSNAMYSNPHPHYQAQHHAYTISAPTGAWPGMPIPPQSTVPFPPPPPPPPPPHSQQAQNYQGYSQNYGTYNGSYSQTNGGRGGDRW